MLILKVGFIDISKLIKYFYIYFTLTVTPPILDPEIQPHLQPKLVNTSNVNGIIVNVSKYHYKLEIMLFLSVQFFWKVEIK